jgi:hypothetical protein
MMTANCVRPNHLSLLAVLASLSLTGCDGRGTVAPEDAVGESRAYNIWQPGPDDTCTPEIHNGYSVVGPDGLLYPTWHPPVDPATGCTFGHEHGRDPSGSDLYDEVGAIPFGYANEVLDSYDPTTPRHEDHVGHKIEWENDVEMRFGDDVTASLFTVRCDVLVKMHQGTHSKDAFTNNLHELAYHIRCSDGTEIHATVITTIGTPGEFVSSCDRDRHVVVGPAVPATSPEGGGRRAIPDRTCVEEHILVGDGERSNIGAGLRESWEISQSLRTEGGRRLASFNPYFQVLLPSRYYDPAQPDGVGRVIDLCYEVEPNGDRAHADECDESTAEYTITDMQYDDPRSLFNGVRRFVDINSNIIANEDGPSTWYTDPFGRNARPERFPGSIRQFIARINNDRGIGMSGPAIGRDRDYSGSGTHSPN